MNVIKRITAGLLSALTVVGSCPVVHAAEMGDGQPSGAEIQIGEQLELTPGMDDIKAHYLTRDPIHGDVDHVQWPHKTVLSDGTEIYGFCGDYTKRGVGPQTPSALYKVTQRADERYGMELYGIATYSPARINLDTFMKEIDPSGMILNAGNFDETERFIAVQLALWVATGQLKYNADEAEGYRYEGSGDSGLGYPSNSNARTIVPRDGKTPSEHKRMWVVDQLLKKGKEFATEWQPVGHAPWNGGFLAYCPGCETYDAAKATREDSNKLIIPENKGLINSGVFKEKEIDGKAYLILPMSVASATPLKNETGITVKASELPAGSMLTSKDGSVKNVANGGDASLELKNIQRNDALCSNEKTKNGNNQAYGDTFFLCIPKDQAEALDANNAEVGIHISAEMDVNRYNVMLAESIDNDLQPDILVEPGIRHINCGYTIESKTITPNEFTKLTIAKTDEDGNPLPGCKFQITYTDTEGRNTTRNGETTATGEAVFENLPLNTNVTITETEAPEGYQLLPPKTVNTGNNTDGQGIRVPLVNKKTTDTVNLKILKKDANDATKSLKGAKFKVEYKEGETTQTLTGETDASGSLSFTGLPLGAEVTITETDPPAGYELMSLNPVTKTLPTTPGGTRVAEYTFTDQETKEDGELKIRKVDADTGKPLAGASFRLKQIDGSFTTSVGPTGTDGYATISGENLPTGSYEVTEINAPEGYMLNPEKQTF